MDDEHSTDFFKPETLWENLAFKVGFVVGSVGVVALLWFFVRQR